MALIVGIDLGTTFSAVARLDDTGRAVIVHNSDGENITPSVVGVRGAKAFDVGEEARKQLGEPDVFGRFKRKMGTKQIYSSDHGEFSPTDLSALVLAKLKSETEKATGEQITEAVVTIPANFSNEAREATLGAAKTANLNVKYIINEPTAAAMYFAFIEGKDLGGVYAVFDLGGGTFDVTIMRINGQDIDVLATEGVSALGGDDFDEKLIKIVKDKYTASKGGSPDDVDFSSNDAEDLKKSLSRQEKRNTRAYGSGGRVDIEVERTQFEEAISTYISQIEMLCESAIEEAKIGKDEIEAVILAGGSTRIPAVKDSVKRVFGKEPVSFGNPDEVVALGAAIYAAFKTEKTNLNPIQAAAVSKIKIGEITSKYFGSTSVGFNLTRKQEELQNVTIIAKGTKIPAEKSETFFTIHDGQDFVNCTVTEANSDETDLNFVKIVWEGQLGPLPAGRPAGQPIEIKFSYDANQVMRCEFKDKETGIVTDVDLTMGKEEAKSKLDIDKFTVE